MAQPDRLRLPTPGSGRLAASGRSAFLSRRRLMQIGGLGALGLDAACFERLLAAAPRPATTRPISACILVFYYGGPSQLDTWDPKPQAPDLVRGEFRPIATSVPGQVVSEHLPHCARVRHHLALVHSLHHPMRNHNAAAVEALCGRTPLRGDLELLANDPATDFPCLGSAVSRLVETSAAAPAYVALPHTMYNVVMLPGQTAGFLGASYEPLRIERDPNTVAQLAPELDLPAHFSAADLDQRKLLWQLLDAQQARIDARGAAHALDGYYQRAFDLLRSPAVRTALDMGQEPPALRERYGRNIHGQSLLLARRLVEAGVRFVSVYDRQTNGLNNWDTHVENFRRLKDDLLPPADQGLAALIDDLAKRGLLESTLVVAVGEFGRTPKLSSAGGRDHWPDCYTAVLAGGGLQGGATHGASDKLGAYPARDPTTPGDLAATIFARFGLDPAQQLHDASGRAYRLAEGEPLASLFA